MIRVLNQQEFMKALCESDCVIFPLFRQEDNRRAFDLYSERAAGLESMMRHRFEVGVEYYFVPPEVFVGVNMGCSKETNFCTYVPRQSPAKRLSGVYCATYELDPLVVECSTIAEQLPTVAKMLLADAGDDFT